MFCGECGTKNNESAKFCKDCGAKLSKAKVENKTTTNTNNTNSSSNINMDSIKNFVMKNKMPFIIGGVVILLIILYFILNSLVFGPKKVVLNYAKAQINGDIAKQIEYSSGYGESDFVTKDIVNKKYGNKKVEDEIVKMRVLSDKEVEKLNTGDSKLESTIRKYLDSSQDSSSLYKKYVVEYITKGSTKSKTLTVNIMKDNKKNFLIFNKWTALGSDVVSRDVSLKTAKGADVSVEGIKLTKKYLNSEDSDSSYDVYDLGTVLKKNVTISVKIDNLEFTKDEYTYDNKLINVETLYSLKLSDKSKKEVSKVYKKFITDFTNYALNNEDISKFKNDSSMTDTFANSSYFKTCYNTLVEYYDSRKAKSLEITDVEITSSSFYNKILSVTATVKYSYDYADDATISKKSGSGSKTTTLKFDTSKGDFKVYDGYLSSYKYIF